MCVDHCSIIIPIFLGIRLTPALPQPKANLNWDLLQLTSKLPRKISTGFLLVICLIFAFCSSLYMY